MKMIRCAMVALLAAQAGCGTTYVEPPDTPSAARLLATVDPTGFMGVLQGKGTLEILNFDAKGCYSGESPDLDGRATRLHPGQEVFFVYSRGSGNFQCRRMISFVPDEGGEYEMSAETEFAPVPGFRLVSRPICKLAVLKMTSGGKLEQVQTNPFHFKTKIGCIKAVPLPP